MCNTARLRSNFLAIVSAKEYRSNPTGVLRNENEKHEIPENKFEYESHTVLFFVGDNWLGRGAVAALHKTQ